VTDPTAQAFAVLLATQCLTLSLLTAPLAAQNPPLLKEFQAVGWNTPYSAWLKAHPAAKCLEAGGTGDRADEQWCYRCIETSGAEKHEWLFYAFDAASPVCRLEQFHGFTSGAPAGALEQTRSALESALTSRLGEPGAGAILPESGSFFWHDTRHWRSADREVYLYRREGKPQPPAVELLARAQSLIAARGQDDQLLELEAGLWAPSSPLDRRLIADLRQNFPALASLLAASPPDKPQRMAQTTLSNLLQAASTAPATNRAELLIAADRITNFLTDSAPPPAGTARRTEKIAGFTLDYAWSPLGAAWVYEHNLLWQVLREYSNTEWGTEAFLLLETLGWDTGVGCEKGSDQFREVIARGEKFLADQPTGPHRIEVALDLAAAYETWWSLSRAPATDDYATAENYRAGAESALEKAIGMYQEVLKLAPSGLEAAYARRHLPRLKLRIDTRQRRFYCIYD